MPYRPRGQLLIWRNLPPGKFGSDYTACAR